MKTWWINCDRPLQKTKSQPPQALMISSEESLKNPRSINSLYKVIKNSVLRSSLQILILMYMFFSTTNSFGQDDKNSRNASSPEDDMVQAMKVSRDVEEMQEASSKTVRKFHEVLDELLAEFGYDVKQGQITGLKNLAIRKIDLSDTLPDSYKEYLKLLISERIRDNSQLKLINCISCGARSSRFADGKLVITSPSTNISELKTAAERLGIEFFMDAILVYHSTHMVLAFQVFRVDTNEQIWARSYNSETVKSRFQKLAIDYSQVAKSRPGEEYVPDYRYLLGFGAANLPNIAGKANDSSMIDLQLRATERFNNRKTEFGMMLSAYVTLSSILKPYPTEGTSTSTTATTEAKATTDANGDPILKPYKTAIQFSGLFAHNFLGSVESYNNIRQGIHLGAGAFLAPSYLAGTVRVGWDLYFGRRFVLSVSAVHIAASKVLVSSQLLPAKGGTGGDVVLSFNY